MMRHDGNRRAARATTLIELVIAISVAGIISLSAGTLMLEGSTVLARSAGRANLADAGARTIEQMVRMVREIAQDSGLTGLAQISTADTTDLRFGTSGFRQNGSVIEITADSGTTWNRACINVGALTLKYYNKTGAQLTSVPLSSTDRAAVRQVSIELQLSLNGESQKWRTRVYLRRFMNEAFS